MSSTAPLREALVDLAALRENVARAAALAGHAVPVDVGRDACGHGLLPIARAAIEAGASALIVADAAEEELLHRAGVRAAVSLRAVAPGLEPSRPDERMSAPAERAAYGYGLPGLAPVMTLRAGIVSVKRVAAGHGVSYGMDYRTGSATTLVIVPLGYADGVPRAAGPRAGVLIGDRRYPVAGRIAMDQFVVDVGDDPVELGEPAVVFGPGVGGEPTAVEWAAWAGTVPDDILSSIGRRVARRYRDDRG